MLKQRQCDINTTIALDLLADICKTTRRKKSMSMDKLAEKSGVGVGVICDLEARRGRIPTLQTFMRLIKTLDIPRDVVLGILYADEKYFKSLRAEIAEAEAELKRAQEKYDKIIMESVLV